MLRSKSKMKEDMILRLNSDKLQLEKEVAGLKERLNKEAEKQVKPGKHHQWNANGTKGACLATQEQNSVIATVIEQKSMNNLTALLLQPARPWLCDYPGNLSSGCLSLSGASVAQL